MIETERSAMVSPAPSSESSFIVRMNDEEHAPTPNVEVQEKQGLDVIDMGDGDFELWVNGSVFKTHTYLLKKFIGLKYLVKNALENEGSKNTNRGIRIQRDDKGVSDFQNMFKVLYASVVDGPFEFDSPTLVSALRIATAYDHPNLRSFAIKHLESVPLSAIERICLAREFGLASWEGPAYIELCDRDEAITKEEANLLGIDAFVHIAKIREGEQRRRGRVIDVAEPAAGSSLPTSAGGDSSPASTKTPRPNQKKPKKKSTTPTPNSEGAICGGTPTVTPPETAGSKPSFIGVPTPKAVDTKMGCSDSKISQHLEVPGCECKGSSSYTDQLCPCRVSPCVYEAIKALQTQQAAHIDNIQNLEETIQELEDRSTSVPEAVSIPSPVMTSVAEQVVKWLSSMRA